MNYTHLKERQYYEDVYDHLTVEAGRRGIVYYYDFYSKFEQKIPADDKIDRPGNVLLLNTFYLQTVGYKLIQRYEERDAIIEKWIAADKTKDDQVASARLTKEPSCRHCNKTGLRITDKSLMRQKEGDDVNGIEEVLFMLKCPHCDKNSAFWEDGAAWKIKPTLCPKCNIEMQHTTASIKKAITFTYTCPSCKHSYKDKIDLADKTEKSDPDYEEDRIHYCLIDEEFRKHIFEIKRCFEGLAEIGREMKEREDNKHIYDAMKEMKKPKIAELAPLLSPALEKAGYIEFGLDKPEMGKFVIVGFSCLDGKSDRGDYDSQKTLKKIINNTLEDTNWRLMSDGISYRLGCLSGRLRAYESEDDLKNLAASNRKLILKSKQKIDSSDIEKNAHAIKGEDGKDIIF
jgi:Zn-finger nucleic acid-binding protein